MAKRKSSKRQYKAAISNRFTSGFGASAGFNQEVKLAHATLVKRAIDLIQNDPIANSAHKRFQTQVVGHGFKFTSNIQNADGKLNTKLNQSINEAFNDWSVKATVTRDTLTDLTLDIMSSLFTYGESLILFKRGEKYGDYAFRIQILDPSVLDASFDAELRSGNTIRSSVEFDADANPVAYHIFKNNKDVLHKKRTRLAAKDILHTFIKTLPNQIRGVPMLSPVMYQLHNLQEFSDVELIAARVSASLTTFLTPPEEHIEDDADEDNEKYYDEVEIDALSPASVHELPPGFTVTSVNPTHPNTNFAEFRKAHIQAIAGALNLAYHSLSADTREGSYSSLRAAALVERDYFKQLQKFFTDKIMQRIWREWFAMASLTDNIRVPKSKQKQAKRPIIIGRSFPYVDPAKDMQAIELNLINGLKSRSQVSSENGQNYEETLAAIEADQLLEEKYGVECKTSKEISKTQIAMEEETISDAIEQSKTEKDDE